MEGWLAEPIREEWIIPKWLVAPVPHSSIEAWVRWQRSQWEEEFWNKVYCGDGWHRRVEWPQASARPRDGQVALPSPVRSWSGSVGVHGDGRDRVLLAHLLMEGLATSARTNGSS